MTAAPRVVVVGGGISGLTAAYTVRKLRPDADVTLLEARARLGGNIVTERHEGFVIDGGPDSFVRSKPHATELCRELGLDSELISTREESRHVYVVRDGTLVPLPAGMALGVPTRIAPLLSTPLLSPAGKLRMLGDLVLPGHFQAPDGDESIASFVRRRFGTEAAEMLAGPLLGGIYAGDVEALSLRSSFPQLLELERSRGSVVLGMFAAQTQKGARGSRVGELLDLARWMRRHEQAHSPFLSLRRGMGSLPEALAAALPAGAVHTNAAVEGLVPPTSARGPWRTRLASGAELESEVVIVTTPAHVASRVLPDAALAKELARIPYVSTATVFFALDRARVSHPLNGVGFVVPKGEGRILAATWVNSKWEHRAPDGSVLVRAFLGGARERSLLQTHGDPALAELARTELERVMGPLGPALFTRVFRYTDSNPQPVLGHAGRVARIQAAAGRLPRFALAGAAFDGVGIPDCVRQAKEAATRALDQC